MIEPKEAMKDPIVPPLLSWQHSHLSYGRQNEFTLLKILPFVNGLNVISS